jgi:hypothetical protein
LVGTILAPFALKRLSITQIRSRNRLKLPPHALSPGQSFLAGFCAMRCGS